MRDCGDCGLCCKTCAVESINKPQFTWCQHYIKGKGCNIYDTRPTDCKDFTCMWLEGALPLDMKPNKCGCVIVANYIEGKEIITVWENRPGASLQDPVDGFVCLMRMIKRNIEIREFNAKKNQGMGN